MRRISLEPTDNDAFRNCSGNIPEHKRGKPGNEWGRLPEWSSSWSRHLLRPDYPKLWPRRMLWQLFKSFIDTLYPKTSFLHYLQFLKEILLVVSQKFFPFSHHQFFMILCKKPEKTSDLQIIPTENILFHWTRRVFFLQTYLNTPAWYVYEFIKRGKISEKNTEKKLLRDFVKSRKAKKLTYSLFSISKLKYPRSFAMNFRIIVSIEYFPS